MCVAEGVLSVDSDGHFLKSYSGVLPLRQTSLVHGIMVSHSEEDLLCIRAAFLKLTGNSLYSTLQVPSSCCFSTFRGIAVLFYF